nr:hypothetical protein [Tanacetum cinerariifolium]
SLCSKECRKNTESLNNKIDELKNNIEELKNDLYEANVYKHSYKLGKDQLEVRIAKYKAREAKYIETIRSLERDKECNLGKINKLISDVETLHDEKDLADGNLARLLNFSKDLEDITESQRSERVKEGLGYNAVPPPAADLYLSPKKDLSWTGLPEFMDDTVTDYSRPSPTVANTSAEDQNNDTSTSEETASINPSKAFIKFIKPKESQPESMIEEQETPKKPQVKNSEQNRQSNRRPKGNQRNWNNLKSYQLGPEFVLHKKSCFNCGDFSHLAKDYRRRVQRETNRSSGPKPHGNSMRPPFRSAGHKPHGPSMNPRRPTMNGARPYKTFFQTPSFKTRPFLKSSAVNNSYRAPWVSTANRKFTTGSTKNHTADMGRKGKAGSSQNNIDDQVLGLVAHLVANLTPNTARSCVMYSTSSTHGKVSNIPTVLTWVDNISSDGLLPSILLLVVVIVAIIIVVVTLILIVVVVAIVVVVFVVAIIGVVFVGVSAIIKLLFVIIGFLLVLSAFAMLAACAFRAATTRSSISYQMAA